MEVVFMVLGDQTYSLKLDRPSPMSYTHFEDPFNTFDFASLESLYMYS